MVKNLNNRVIYTDSFKKKFFVVVILVFVIYELCKLDMETTLHFSVGLLYNSEETFNELNINRKFENLKNTKWIHLSFINFQFTIKYILWYFLNTKLLAIQQIIFLIF